MKDIIKDPVQPISDSFLERTIDTEWSVTLAGESLLVDNSIHNWTDESFKQVTLLKLRSNRFPTREIPSAPAVHGTALRVHVNTF